MDRLLGIFWNPDHGRVRALWRLVIHGVALFVLAWVLVVIVAAVAPELLAESSTGLPSVVTALGSTVVVGLASAVIGRTVDRRSFADFGLRLSKRWWADFAAGVIIGAVLMAGIFVVELGAGWLTIRGRFVGAAPGQPFALALLGPLVVFVAVGFYEELLSRGYHLRNLAEGLCFDRLGPRGALILATALSSAVFGLLHAGNEGATVISTINVALAGCMLALGLLWTAELALPIGVHLSWNFCQGNLFGFPVSGNFAGPRVFDVEQGGAPLITGGAFGPEAGLVGIGAMLVGAGLIAAWVRLSRGELRVRGELAIWTRP